MIYSIRLCDDNPVLLEEYKSILMDLAKKNNLEINLLTNSSGEQLLFDLADTPQSVDIIFLDVLMSGINGIETARKLREQGCDAQLIFLTSSEEYVFESFDTAPLNYLVKDTVTPEKFEQVFLHAISNCQNRDQQCYAVETGGVTKRLPLKSISYFEVQNRIITVHYNQKEELSFYGKMEDIQKDLEPLGFIRSHRSFLVNVAFVDSIQKSEVTLVDGSHVPVSAPNFKNVKQAFSKYLTSI